jgi:hypothetical protein
MKEYKEQHSTEKIAKTHLGKITDRGGMGYIKNTYDNKKEQHVSTIVSYFAGKNDTKKDISNYHLKKFEEFRKRSQRKGEYSHWDVERNFHHDQWYIHSK